jgi:dihydrofolate reductase
MLHFIFIYKANVEDYFVAINPLYCRICTLSNSQIQSTFVSSLLNIGCMRKIVLFNLMTLDGYFEGENADISWHNVDQEFNDFAIAQLKTADMLLFGRKTYQLMAAYWPTAEGIKDNPVIADLMNQIDKIVFSKSLERAHWDHARVISEGLLDEVKKLKSIPGKDVFIFGSADLSSTLIDHDLIDEFRIMINPLILGNGTPMFQNITTKIDLQLLKTKVFGNGNVLLNYIPKK